MFKKIALTACVAVLLAGGTAHAQSMSCSNLSKRIGNLVAANVVDADRLNAALATAKTKTHLSVHEAFGEVKAIDAGITRRNIAINNMLLEMEASGCPAIK